jgi:RNA polymerase subunit RPABC4/transcription elongation factor Spt4
MENKKYCMFCKKLIPKDTDVCSFCGKNQKVLEYGHKKKCSYCNILIPADAAYCRYCGTPVAAHETFEDNTSIFDYKSTFVNLGGNKFGKNDKVHIFLKNGKASFKTFGKGECLFDIKKDFLMCERLTESKAKKFGLDTKTKTYIMLMFNDVSILLEEDDTASEVISYIYRTTVDSIYETETTFYNADNSRFTIF